MQVKADGGEITAFYGLRGYAILMIMLSHCSGLLVDANGRNLLDWWGAFGVSIFIFQSGYLCVRKYGGREIPNFGENIKGLKRKIQKFYGLHIVTLLLSLPLVISLSQIDFIKTALKFILNALMLQSYIPKGSIYFSFNGVSWYLTLVIFFEMVGPSIADFLLKKSVKEVYALFVGILTMQVGLLWIADRVPSIAHWLVYVCPATRTLDFVLGGGTYVLCANTKADIKKRNALLCAALLAGAILLVCAMRSSHECFSALVWVPVCGVLLYVLSFELPNWAIYLFENRVAVALGKASLELFLVHQLVIRYTDSLFPKLGIYHPVVRYGAALAVSWAIAVSIQKGKRRAAKSI